MASVLADEVRRLLDEHRLSLQGASIRTGIGKWTIHRWTKGATRPTAANMVLWAKAFGEPVEYWLKLAGYDPARVLEGSSKSSRGAAQRLPRIPMPPEAVRDAVRNAPSEEQRLDILTEYIRRPEFGLDLNREDLDSLPPAGKKVVLRVVERLQGVRLLEEDDAA